MTVIRETFAVRCQHTGCRWTRLLIRSRVEAEAIARAHEESGHQVEIYCERLTRMARGLVCEVRR